MSNQILPKNIKSFKTQFGELNIGKTEQGNYGVSQSDLSEMLTGQRGQSVNNLFNLKPDCDIKIGKIKIYKSGKKSFLDIHDTIKVAEEFNSKTEKSLKIKGIGESLKDKVIPVLEDMEEVGAKERVRAEQIEQRLQAKPVEGVVNKSETVMYIIAPNNIRMFEMAQVFSTIDSELKLSEKENYPELKAYNVLNYLDEEDYIICKTNILNRPVLHVSMQGLTKIFDSDELKQYKEVFETWRDKIALNYERVDAVLINSTEMVHVDFEISKEDFQLVKELSQSLDKDINELLLKIFKSGIGNVKDIWKDKQDKVEQLEKTTSAKINEILK